MNMRKRIGVSELLFLTVLITCLAPYITLPSAIALDVLTVPISKPGCEDKCGNVSVPFPFGIGDPKCFLDGWYEMECNKSIKPKLSLKRTQLEVLNISMDNYNQWVMVKGPITYFDCQRNQTQKPIDLTGAPFSFSYVNTFVAASCGVPVRMNWSLGHVFSQTGCRSTCTARNYHNISCDGVGCCQTSFSSIPNSFEISFDDSTNSIEETQTGGDQCKFAFIIDGEYWDSYKNVSTSFKRIRDMGYVPLRLDWYLANYSYFYMFNKKMPEYMWSDEHGRSCTNSSSVVLSSLECRCSYGLLGNPYLSEGCTQDMNECEAEHYVPCSGPGVTCVNTYGGYHCSYQKKFLLIGFGSAFGALFLLFGIWGLYKIIKKKKEMKRKRKFFKRNGGLLLQQELSSAESTIEKTKIFDSNELDKATLQFSIDRVLGQGGQGTVYKGMLDSGKIVAVKKSTIVDEEKLSEFINEVVILSQINHRNVVQLLGCCLETEVPILVYEFIPNGTLSQYIHEGNEEFPFTWNMRLRIAAEVAGALSYLHSAASFPIYHRDIKSTNILLDEQYRAKVADFGTSRTISLEQTHLTTLVYGTLGYLDPEYFQSCQFTEKSDVYSFGVVLVELLTGQRAICPRRAQEGRNLATYFTMSMESNQLFDIVDAQVLEDGEREEILVVACLALRCLNLNGRNRPTMKEVAMELEGLRNSGREAPSNSQQNYDEIDYSTSDSTATPSLLPELPSSSVE